MLENGHHGGSFANRYYVKPYFVFCLLCEESAEMCEVKWVAEIMAQPQRPLNESGS
jgi:hypothetical protein